MISIDQVGHQNITSPIEVLLFHIETQTLTAGCMSSWCNVFSVVLHEGGENARLSFKKLTLITTLCKKSQVAKVC